MRVLIQRVAEAAVRVEGETIGAIERGLLVLVGVTEGDGPEQARQLASKTANLRIFEDEQGKMNRSALDLGLAVLVVSQFTLYADVRKGRRPSFVHAAPPEIARPLVDRFAGELRALGLPVASGEFGAHMRIALINDGPVTIWIDSEAL
ncbi:MAG TPA: D-aminoacyl-tRNA deacylase [Thermomicrobiaceae bacterium]|nr:D-aminoacyl-tRNA deacylase [Thermomicrobiaceae bacterium]